VSSRPGDDEVGSARARRRAAAGSTSTNTASTRAPFKAAVRAIAPIVEDRGIDEIYMT
jgi:hypothetical protein